MRKIAWVFWCLLAMGLLRGAAAEEGITFEQDAKGTTIATHEGRRFPLSYESAMVRFEAEDQKDTRKGGIVFTGSSTFVKWQTLVQDMAPLPVVNRAFGGSTSPQVWYYAERAVLPREPKVIVVYVGDNDLVQSAVTVESYLKYVGLFVAKVRAKLPQTRILFVSNKPSVARWALWPKYQEANEKLKEFCERGTLLTYVDTTPTLLDAKGVVREDCFGKDKLHFKPEVYAEWTKIIKPVLERVWSEAGGRP